MIFLIKIQLPKNTKHSLIINIKSNFFTSLVHYINAVKVPNLVKVCINLVYRLSFSNKIFLNITLKLEKIINNSSSNCFTTQFIRYKNFKYELFVKHFTAISS